MIERADLDAQLAELGAMIPTGMESAVIGIVGRFGMGPVALLDRDRCVQLLVDQGMTDDEAEEWMGFNVEGAWMGPGTPAFCRLLSVPL